MKSFQCLATGRDGSPTLGYSFWLHLQDPDDVFLFVFASASLMLDVVINKLVIGTNATLGVYGSIGEATQFLTIWSVPVSAPVSKEGLLHCCCLIHPLLGNYVTCV